MYMIFDHFALVMRRRPLDITNVKDERIERDELYKPKYTIHKDWSLYH